MAGTDDLAHFLKNTEVREFSARPYYEEHTDSVILYMRNCASYSKRLNRILTLFLDEDDDGVGVEVKGVTQLIEIHKSFSVGIVDHKLRLGVLLAFGMVEKPEDPALNEQYQPALQELKVIEVEVKTMAVGGMHL